MNISESHIDTKLIEIFEIKDFFTISNVTNHKRIDLSNDNNSIDLNTLVLKAITILNEHFDKNIWIRITLWDKTENAELDNMVLQSIKSFLQFKKVEENSLILYYFIEHFEAITVQNLVQSSIYFDRGLQPSINMTCFYFNFDIPVLINIYDDRGMDIVMPNNL